MIRAFCLLEETKKSSSSTCLPPKTLKDVIAVQHGAYCRRLDINDRCLHSMVPQNKLCVEGSKPDVDNIVSSRGWEGQKIHLFTLPWQSSFPAGVSGKEPPANAGDVGDSGSIPGSGRSPGGGHADPLQYSCLGNAMNRGTSRAMVHGVAKSRTQLNTTRTFTFLPHGRRRARTRKKVSKPPLCSKNER